MGTAPIVAHSANPFLPATTVWMYDQIRTLKRYKPIVMTQARQNLDQFPFEPVFSSEDFSFIGRMSSRLVNKVRGTYAGYADWLRDHQAVMIHAHFGQEGFRCLSAKHKVQIPLVTTFYGLDVSALPQERSWQRRYRRLFAEGDLFVVEGPYMGERLIALGCPARRVVVQHLGVDLDNLKASENSPNEYPVVLTYAVFREKKGLIYAIKAFAKIVDKYPQAQLRMIGDGPLRSECEAEIQYLGIEDRVTILGMLPHKQALEELGKASVLLYPSVTASDGDTEGGAPVALIEAMAMGVPVVSSMHADIPEVVPNQIAGLLFAERDVVGLSEGLDTLLSTPDLRRKMGTLGRAHVEIQHNLDIQAEKLECIYDRILGK